MIIYRYLSSQLFSATMAVAFILSLITLSGRFLGYMAEAAQGEIEGWAIALVMLYRLPEFLVLILPLSLFLGVLLSYGRMYVEYEMIVLKACGLGQWRLLGLSILPAVFMALLIAYFSLILTPKGIENYSKIVQQQYTRSALELLTPGHFFTSKNGDVIYAEKLNTDKTELQGFFSSNKAQKRYVVLVAEKGKRLLDGNTGEQFMVLENGYRYEFEKGSYAYSETHFKKYRYKIKEPDVNRIRNRISSMPTIDLIQSTEPEEMAELQWRMALPPLAIIVVLLAVPFSKVNPRQGRFIKLLPAIMLYLTYVGAVLLTKNAIAEGRISAYPGIWAVHVIYFFIALIFLEWEKISIAFNRRRARRLAHETA